MSENLFTDCEKSLTPKDFSLIEQDLSVRLPADLKSHYLKFNGGTPKNTIWNYAQGGWEETEVRDFFPFLYFKAKQDDPDFTANGIAKEQWQEKKLPPALLPFAIDWGGNYFCVDVGDGKVYYFLRDVWNDEVSVEKNWMINTRYVSDSVSLFVNGLTAE